ncbi:MAG: LTA synthase family protein [Ginsengibacter sp.]
MNQFNLKPVTKWLLASGILIFLGMTVMRFIFFYHFRPGGYTFSQNINPFLLGVRFDIRTVCSIILFPFLVSNLALKYKPNKKLSTGSYILLGVTVIIMLLLLMFIKKGHVSNTVFYLVDFLFLGILVWLGITKNCNPFANRTSRVIFKVYFFIIALILVFLYAFDFQHYDYLHQRLNASVLNFAGDAKISMNMIWETYPVVWLVILIIISIAVLYYLILRIYKYLSTEQEVKSKRNIFNVVALALLMGLGIFGRFNQYPLRWSDAFSFEDDFKANLALNPVQSFLSTLQFRNSMYDIDIVKKNYALIASYLQVKNIGQKEVLNFTRNYIPDTVGKKPNVVIVICESFSGYKSSMWGNPLNTTPYFNSLCKNGIFFDRCFTPSYGTARGIWAVLSGTPDVEYPNTSSRNPAYVDQHTIINDYKGYEKYYFIGGSSSWANIRGLLTNNIYGLHLMEEENFKSKPIDVWGISDKRLFLEANEVYKKQTSPFVSVIQTADNHRPYTIPEEDKAAFKTVSFPKDTLKKYGFESNEELNAFRYTDFCFETFIETAKKEKYFTNTIFVFVGDHGISGDVGDMFPRAWEIDGLTTRHVPLLFYAPALLAPRRLHNTCSQVDLLPSVTALAALPYTNSTMGINLFDTAQTNTHFKNIAFLFEPNLKQTGIVTDKYVFTHNVNGGKEDFRSSIDNQPIEGTESLEDKKLLKQLTEAYYQTAKYLLYNNKKGKLP